MSVSCPNCGFQYQCICPQLPQLTSNYTLCLLMHPNEVTRDTNTGKLLSQCQLNVSQTIWQRKEPDTDFIKMLEDPNYAPVLLFPDKQALSLTEFKATYCTTQDSTKPTSHKLAANKASPDKSTLSRKPVFIILDGTWQEARKMLNKSRWLEDIPKLNLVTQGESNYKLRRNQQSGNLCTFEIAAQLLSQLGEMDNQQQMLQFFQHYLQVFQADKSGHALNRV